MRLVIKRLISLLLALHQIVRVRKAAVSDAEALHRVVLTSMGGRQSESPSAEQWRKMIAGEGHTSTLFSVLEHIMSKRVVGVVGTKIAASGYGLPRRDHITLLSIDVALQRRGHGRRLLTHILSEQDSCLVPERCTSLFVRASNRAAITLYKRLGFRRHTKLRQYYSDPVEAALLFVRWRRRPARIRLGPLRSLVTSQLTSPMESNGGLWA